MTDTPIPEDLTDAERARAERFKQELESANTLGVQAEELVEYWREEHNQVAAERDALAARLERADADALLRHRCHTAAIERWHETCDAVLNAVIEYGTLRSVVEVVADWLEGSDALDDEVCDLIRRAIDASPTEGNPDAD